ncbi:MAG: RDD family protein [Actinobacteria bacterium]|nr:MAG: RDD family protein [Actinomycetota bacterium]
MPASDTGETLKVETPESVAFDFELANVGSRGLAVLLDTLLLTLLIAAEAAAAAGVLYLASRYAAASFRAVAAWTGAATLVVAFLTAWGYFVFGEVVRGGRTPGKRALGLRVVRDDGSRVGFADSTIRNVLRIVDVLPGNYAVGIASVIVSSRRKRLGDMAAGTVVVREAAPVVIELDPGRSPEAVALAREFLERREGLSPEARLQVGAEVLRALGEEPAAGAEDGDVAARIAEAVGG